jgi:hypothetical protein
MEISFVSVIAMAKPNRSKKSMRFSCGTTKQHGLLIPVF